MIINNICSPAVIYLGFSLTQIIIDIYKNMYNTAFLKFIVSIVFTVILNLLCQRGLNIISWIIVFIPFIFMTVITSILLYMFGLDPFFGKLNYEVQDINNSNINKFQINPRDNMGIHQNINDNSEIQNNFIRHENSNQPRLPINRVLNSNNVNNNQNDDYQSSDYQNNNENVVPNNRNRESKNRKNYDNSYLINNSEESSSKLINQDCYKTCLNSNDNKKNKTNNSNYCKINCQNNNKSVGYKTI